MRHLPIPVSIAVMLCLVADAFPSKLGQDYELWLERWEAEQKSIAEIKKYGGSVKSEVCAPQPLRKKLGEERSRFVTHVSLMSHRNKKGRSIANQNESDEALQHVKHFTQLKRLFLKGTQATDENLQHLIGLNKLQVLYMWSASKVTDKGFAHLRKIRSLTYIHCSYSGITDDALLRLDALENLTALDLVGNDFTDKALANAGKLSGLKSLSIGAGHVRGVTDAGLAHLKKLPQLQSLNLMATSVTDKGLEHLKALKSLRTLWLDATGVTDAGVRKLQLALPDCKISH